MHTPPAAAWYPDPENAGLLRYWNGTAWTEHRHPARERAETLSKPSRRARKRARRAEKERRREPRIGEVKVIKLDPLLGRRKAEKVLNQLAEEGWVVTSAAPMGGPSALTAYTLRFEGQRAGPNSAP